MAGIRSFQVSSGFEPDYASLLLSLSGLIQIIISMKKFTFLIPALFIILLSCRQVPEGHNALSPQEKSEGWVLLFDGESMEQWRSYLADSLYGWIVEDGTMKALGLGDDLGGDIITREQFENFQLSLEWKISPGGNSGIMFMVHEDTAYHAVYETGPEYQLLDDIGYPDTLEDWQLAGANYAMHLAGNKELKPVGEWNTARILKDGSHVEHWLNGKLVLEYELWTGDWKSRVASGKWKDYPGYGTFEKGHIALQDHGAAVWFRNIKIRGL